VLALVVRVGWVLSLGDALSWPDEFEFTDIAHHLAAGEGYVADSFRSNPVLPAYLAVMFRLFGESYAVARLGQALLGALTAVLVGRMAMLLAGPAVGLTSAVLVALYLPHVYLAGVFYVDSVLMFVLALATYLAAWTLKRHASLWQALVCGGAVGLTALTRPLFLLLLPVVALAWLYGSRARWSRRIVLCCALVTGSAAVVLPWTARNARVFGRVIPVSSGFGTKFWQGNTVLANGGPFDRELMVGSADWERRLARLPAAERRVVEARYAVIGRQLQESEAELHDRYLASDEVLLGVALDEIRADPGRALRLALRKMATLFSPFSGTYTHNAYTSRRLRLLAASTFYPMLILAAVGAWLAWPRRRQFALVYLLVAGVVAAYTVLNACTRFRLPIDPYLLVFAAVALVAAGRRLQAARRHAPRAEASGAAFRRRPSPPCFPPRVADAR